jgi:hypothetical protein
MPAFFLKERLQFAPEKQHLPHTISTKPIEILGIVVKH